MLGDNTIPQSAPDKPAASGQRGALIWPGKPYPLGATWNGAGVNLALFLHDETEA